MCSRIADKIIGVHHLHEFYGGIVESSLHNENHNFEIVFSLQQASCKCTKLPLEKNH